MKTTMEIPDPVYRRLKAQSAARGLPVRQVLLQLIEQWLSSSEFPTDTAENPSASVDNQQKAARLRAFLDETADLVAGSGGPSLEHILDQGRRRLEDK